MKRAKNLYEPLLNKERIKEIIILASRGKKKRKEVQVVLNNIDYYADEILRMLKDKSYYLKTTRNRTIIEKGKERVLTISPFFPNRILDYCLVEAMKPVIRKGMYQYCVGNVDGRGGMYGKRYVEKHINKYKYYMKLDIRHFYPSVKPQKLYECVCKYVKDKDFLEFTKFIIFQNDELPIGSYYSQWFSNLFLQGLDHYIKEELGVPFYVRYVDDMLIMSNNKKKLLSAMYHIERYLSGVWLSLKRQERAREIKTQPIDFLGFRFYEDKTYLRMRIFKSINRRIKAIKNFLTKHLARSLISYMGWLKAVNGYKYYENHIKPFVSIGYLRNCV